jgi:hypothetical protein
MEGAFHATDYRSGLAVFQGIERRCWAAIGVGFPSALEIPAVIEYIEKKQEEAG